MCEYVFKARETDIKRIKRLLEVKGTAGRDCAEGVSVCICVFRARGKEIKRLLKVQGTASRD